MFTFTLFLTFISIQHVRHVLCEECKDTLLVHIGKTGGSTAHTKVQIGWNAIKRVRKGFTDEGTKALANEKIPQCVKDFIHHHDPDYTKYDSYIVNVRDPVDRLISWFLFSHPKNKLNPIFYEKGTVELYDECYEQLNDFAEHGLDPSRSGDTLKTHDGVSCQELAQSIILATYNGDYRPNYMHIFRNFQYWLNSLLETDEREVDAFAIRTEYFWDDWRSIEKYFGGDAVGAIESITHRTGKNLTIINKTISNRGLTNVCHFLCEEIQVYKKFLERAINLTPDDRKKSLDYLRAKCPAEGVLVKCL